MGPAISETMNSRFLRILLPIKPLSYMRQPMMDKSWLIDPGIFKFKLQKVARRVHIDSGVGWKYNAKMSL